MKHGFWRYMGILRLAVVWLLNATIAAYAIASLYFLAFGEINTRILGVRIVMEDMLFPLGILAFSIVLRFIAMGGRVSLTDAQRSFVRRVPVKAILIVLLSLTALVSYINRINPSYEGVVYYPDPDEDGEFWRGKKAYIQGATANDTPMELPGPLDVWAGGEQKEIVVKNPFAGRTIQLTLSLYESHDSTPPTLEIAVGGKIAGKIQAVSGNGYPSSQWFAKGKRSAYTVTIPHDFVKNAPQIAIRSAAGSWIAIESIKIFAPPLPWEIWRMIPGRIAATAFWTSLALLVALGVFTTMGKQLKTAPSTFLRHCKTASWKHILFYAIMFAGFPLIFFASAELVLKILNVADPALAEDPYFGFKNYVNVFIADPKDASMLMINPRRVKWGANNEAMVPQAMLKRPPNNNYRIMLFGGSNTKYLYPETWVMKDKLQRKYPDREIEIINLGGDAFGTHRIVKMFEEAVKYKPDLLLVYSGHNEFVEKRFYHNILEEPEWVSGVVNILGNFRFYVFARQTIRDIKSSLFGFYSKKEIEEHQTGKVMLDKDVDIDWDLYYNPRFKSEVLKQYEDNLGKMARIARDNKIRMALCTVSSPDLIPPRAPCFDPDIGEKDWKKVRRLMDSVRGILNRYTVYFGKSDKFHLAAKAIAKAKPVIEQAGKIAPDDGDILYWQGFMKYFEQDYASAKSLLLESAKHDCTPHRATPLTNAIVRKVAGLYGLHLIDIESLINKSQPDNVNFGVDMEGKEDASEGLFWDYCHLNVVGKKITLNKFADEIIANGWIETSAGTK